MLDWRKMLRLARWLAALPLAAWTESTSNHSADKDWLHIKDNIGACQGQENVTKCCAGTAEISMRAGRNMVVGKEQQFISQHGPTEKHQGPAVAFGEDRSKSGQKTTTHRCFEMTLMQILHAQSGNLTCSPQNTGVDSLHPSQENSVPPFD